MTAPQHAAYLKDAVRLRALAETGLFGSDPEQSYDDAALLAASICGAQIAFVSVINEERQWLKARIGIAERELPVEATMCVHTIGQAELVVIPDLSCDARTSSLLHVAGPPNLRFYAGLRISNVAGHALGTLCVMGREARPEGLTEGQAISFRALGRQVESQIALRQTMAESARLAEQLREQCLEFEVLADNVNQLVWMATPDGGAYWFNQRWFTYTGTALETMQGTGWLSVLRPGACDELASVIERRWTDGRAWEHTCELRAADGTYRPFLTRAEPIRSEHGEVMRWFGTHTDIRKRVAAETRLQELNATLEQRVADAVNEQGKIEEQLRQAQKMEAVGQLTGGLAHDFNNLLTGITGSLELLRTRLAQGRTSEIVRYVDTAEDAARRAATLTHRLLAFSRRQPLDPKPTHFDRLVSGMGELIRRTLGPSITLDVVAADEVWATLVDPVQLETSLLNLCLNARDAMPHGGVLTIRTAHHRFVEAEATALGLQPGPHVSLSVTDTGTGMAPTLAERAFEPFFTTKPVGAGTGLGLSMVYGFVRQSGGQARIDSVAGEGTTVSLYFPLYKGTAEPAAVTEKVPVNHRATDGETILLVDDEPAVRSLVAEALRDLMYHVVEAESGRTALVLIESGCRIDLLVTDLGLPGGMNGHQLAQAARLARPGLTVLFITGYAEKAVLSEGDLADGMHLVTKPFAMDCLASRVGELMRGPAVH